MQFRHGICSSCKAEYKIPASFAADRARCKKCGGVVEIGAVLDGDAPAGSADETVEPPKRAAGFPPPVPASPPVAKPVVSAEPARHEPLAKTPPQPVPYKPSAPPQPLVPPRPAPVPRAPAAPELLEVSPSGKKRSGPTMKEKLLARRTAEEAGAQTPTPAKASSTVVPTAPMGRVAAAPMGRVAAAPVGRVAAAPVGRVAAPVAKADARTGASSKRPARGAAARGRGRGGKASDDRKKKGPLLLVGSMLALIVIGAGGYFLLFGTDEPVQAKDGGSDEAVQAAIADETSGAEDVALSGETSGAQDDATLADETSGAQDEATLADETSAAEDAARAAPAPEKDPSEIDLSAIQDFGPVEGTGDERWTELQQMASTAIDRSAGAAGNRAKLGLEEVGKPAFPAILNVMKTLDYSTEDGYRNGDLMQRTLTKLVNGNNFGWKYTTEPNDVWFNKKAVQMWATQWERSMNDEAYWLKFSKQEASADGKKDEAPLDAETENALDDLDDM